MRAPELAEHHTIRNRIADRHEEPEAHLLPDLATLQHAALDLIAQFLQELLDPLAADVDLVSHVVGSSPRWCGPQLTVPLIRSFEDRLAADGNAPVMVQRTRKLLGALIADAQERGLVAQNVVRSLRTSRRGKDASGERQRKSKLKSGVDIPTPDEMRAIIAKLPEIDEAARFRPLLLTAIFTGLRASELRGLRWADVDLRRGELHVHQRADRYGRIGRPKSEAGERTVPLPPLLVSVLREHRLACPKGALGLVFPNSKGGIEHRAIVAERGFHPAQAAAGVVNGDGKAKYPGLHSLAISVRAGASTAASTADLSCRSRSCRRGSDMPPSK